jgi:methionyl-tRNA formyltransferase
VKIVFMGRPEFAVPALRACAASRHEVREVVTQPDRPAGRGRHPQPSAVAAAASELGLGVTKPATFAAEPFVSHLRDLGADAFVVVAFGEILRTPHLEIPRLGSVNVHPSLLPRHRGPGPIVGALLAGDDVTGVTTMRIARGVDTGDLYLQRALEIDAGEDAGSLSRRLSHLGAALLVETLDRLAAGSLHPVPQDPARATVTKLLTKADGAVAWTRPALDLYRHVRAMTPWPGAFTWRESASGEPRRVAILRAMAVDELPVPDAPGTVVDVTEEGPIVACGRGRLLVLCAKPAGSREMSGAELVRGQRIERGERWHE